jgi:hypothetical protein
MKCRRIREYIRTRYLGRNFDPGIYNQRVHSPLVFESYSQSYLYFTNIEALIRKELTFKDSSELADHGLAAEIANSNSVCLHARRLQGLFASGVSHKHVGEYYGQCDIGYYERSLQELAAMHGSLRVFLFSDDLSWARENASVLPSTQCQVRVIDEPDSLRCFDLMTRCKHFIIANSSYSWWAAWLGAYPQKTVCAPSVWNRGDWRFPRDLYPSTWKVVQVN